MPPKDKLKGLLSQRERKVPDAVRLKEMNQVRNYNRNQFAKVFDLEKQQVNREKESIQPASAKDVGSAFKLQVYILKLNQILQLKQETFQSLTTSLASGVDIDPAVAQAAQAGDRQAMAAVAAAQAKKITALRGTRGTEATLATSFFSKAELLAAFNEMMAFIKLFMPDLTGNNRQMEQIYSAYLTPLTNLLKQVQGLYPAFFETIPAPRAPARGIPTEERQTYELMRQQSMYLYALLGTMGEFLDDENLRPLVAQDVSLYIKENRVSQIFTSNPLAGNVRSAEVQLNMAAQQQMIQQAAAQQQAQQQEAQARQQALQQQLQQQQQAGLATTAEQQAQEQMLAEAARGQAAAQRALQAFNQRNPRAAALAARGFVGSPQPIGPPAAVAEYVRQAAAMGVPDNRILVDNLRDLLADKIRFVGNNDYSQTQITNAVRQFRQANPQYRGVPGRAPGGQPGQQQQQQQQQAGPAQQGQAAVDLPNVANMANFETTGQNVARVLGIQDAGEIDMLEGLVARAKGIETDEGRILKARAPADVRQLMGELSQRRQDQLNQMFQSENDKVEFTRRAIDGMRQVREAFATQSGAPGRQRELFGRGLPELKKFVEKKGMFPSKMNPKHIAHFMKLNIPPEEVFKLMKKHNIRDGALMEEMEGSGIFDSLKDMASSAWGSVKDSASGWADTISKNMPDMSDVRRAVGKIVPDSIQKHLPDGLKQTFGDKAKNFFGFGATEAGGIPDRHREPFSAPNLDKYGYKQGSAQRMRIMPVDKELVSGLHNLTGGDQLRDNDPEVLRRQDHHDIDVPVSHQQPMHGYGVDGDEDDQLEGGLKRRLMGMPISMFAPRGGRKEAFIPMFSGAELDPYADKFEGGAEAFYEEEEKPHDHDEDPTPFRVRDENYKVNTGRLKKVTYKQ
jgi:hypothetical protein